MHLATGSKSFGHFSFDYELGALTCDGAPVSIGRAAAALLAALLEANGAVVGKNALMEAAWPGTVVEEANLTVQIAALRKALGPSPGVIEWIQTVPRVGYRLPRPSPAPATGRPVIAVLPFANLSADPEQAYFARGLTEDLITALSRFKTLAVTGLGSTADLAPEGLDARETARRLGVRYLLQGSVRRSDARIRVGAQLVEGATGSHIWADRFEGEGRDIFDFQDAITDSVTGLIEPRILKAEIERARRKRPESFDAWDLYVEALPLIYPHDPAGHDQAISLMERAIELDPTYAPGLIIGAWAYEKRYTFNGSNPADSQRALELTDGAMASDPGDAMVLALAGWFNMLLRRDLTAIAFCERAVELNPNNLLVLNFAGLAQGHAGDVELSIKLYQRALELSPGAPDNYVSELGITIGHINADRFAEALVWADRTIATYEGCTFAHLFRSAACMRLGRADDARKALDRAREITPDISIRELTRSCMRSAEKKRAYVQALREAGLKEK